jgi:hypothetical protein
MRALMLVYWRGMVSVQGRSALEDPEGMAASMFPYVRQHYGGKDAIWQRSLAGSRIDFVIFLLCPLENGARMNSSFTRRNPNAEVLPIQPTISFHGQRRVWCGNHLVSCPFPNHD